MAAPITTSLDAFSRIDDPRRPRGGPPPLLVRAGADLPRFAPPPDRPGRHPALVRGPSRSTTCATTAHSGGPRPWGSRWSKQEEINRGKRRERREETERERVR